MPKVLVAVLNQGNIRVELNNMLIRMTHSEVPLKIYYPNSKPIASNRNEIVNQFLENDYTHLLMIDADNPPVRNPLDLLELDKDVIACPTPQYNDSDPDFPIYFVAMEKVEDGWKEHKVKDGLQEVDAVGTGCILIKREVLEDVEAPFMREWNEDGTAEVGLDFKFCEKAKEKGYKIWAHYDYPCRHFKELDLLKIYKLLCQR